MRFPKKKRPLALIALALAVCLAGILPQLSALARNDVDTKAKCSLTVTVSEKFRKEYSGIEELDIPVRLYYVAGMDENGSVIDPETPTGFESFNAAAIYNGAQQNDAAELRELADRLTEYVNAEDSAVAPKAEDTIRVHGAFGIGENGENTLPVGLYLLVADTVNDRGDAYVFQSSLFTLPTTVERLLSTEAEADEGEEPEEEPAEAAPGTVLNVLNYNAALEFKISHEQRFGSVVIDKILDSYNTNLGTATFVFQIKATLEGEEEPVYVGVRSMTFNGPGEKQVVVEHLPVGAIVEVTEIYSGASYTLSSQQPEAVVVIADGDPGAPVSVSFTNSYSGGTTSGSSVTNHYEYNGTNPDFRTWTPQQLTDNTQTVTES